MKSKSFRLLWLGQSFANLGDVLYIIGLISILYAMTESALYLAFLPFLNTFGHFLSGIISPILLNRYRLKSLLVGSQFLKTVLLLVLVILISLQTAPVIWSIFLFIFMIAFLDGLAMPATRAMLPRLINEHEIVKANSFVSVMGESMNIGGWAVGGVFVSIVTGQNVIWFTCLLFAISSSIMLGIDDQTPFSVQKEKIKTSELLKSSWQTIWENPLLRSIHILILVEAIANVVWIAAIIYVFVAEVLQVDESWWGYLNTAFFAGLLFGGLICVKFSVYIEQNLRKIMIIVSFGVSVITFLFGFNSVAWLALILAIFHGLIEQVKGIVINTYLQKEALTEDLPKLYAAQGALVSLFFGISSLLFGMIAEYWGVRIAFSIAGLLLAAGAMYTFFKKERFPVRYN